ncbi:MAG: hypothetical protein QXW97_01095 [Candidatus Pacearchaeota archaeon]
MISLDWLLITLPIVTIFGIALFAMIFLNTYRQFPKMNSEERFWLCFKNATFITLTVIIIFYLFLWFFLEKFLK